MLSELKKRTIKTSIIIVILLVGIGGFLAFIFSANTFCYLSKKTDIYSASISKIQKTKNATIEIDKYNLYGVFLERYETDGKTRKSKDFYCLVLVGDEEDARFMAVKVDAKNEAKLDKIQEEYTDLDNGIDSGERTVIKVRGELTKMTEKEYDYFADYIEENYDYDRVNIPFITVNRCLKEAGDVGSVVVFFIGVILILAGIVILILGFTGYGVKKLKNKLDGMGAGAFSAAENDFIYATKFSNQLSIGQRFTFYTTAFKSDIFENDKIIWVYAKRVKHRTNGIPTGSTYSIVITFLSKKNLNISLKNEGQCNEALEIYSKVSDRIVVGYDDELMKLFNRDFSGFLSIAYNKPASTGYPQDNGYNSYGDNPQGTGYDPYGAGNQNTGSGYDPYGAGNQNTGTGYDPYGTGNQNTGNTQHDAEYHQFFDNNEK